MKPLVLKSALVDMQVCVPESFTDKEVIEFANRENSSGTQDGWSIRSPDDPAQNGDPIRVDCRGRSGYVHIMLVC